MLWLIKYFNNQNILTDSVIVGHVFFFVNILSFQIHNHFVEWSRTILIFLTTKYETKGEKRELFAQNFVKSNFVNLKTLQQL